MKVFQGFQLDMASDFTGLSHGEIRWLREKRIVAPEKTKEGYRFTFSDILTLRLVRVLKFHGVRPKNIQRAHDYLQDYSPDQNLSSLKLYIKEDTKTILYLGNKPQENQLVSMSDYGQFIAAGLLVTIPVGQHLESLRREVVSLDKRLHASLRSKKLIPLSAIKEKYGIGG